MQAAVYQINMADLLWILPPVVVTFWIYIKWNQDSITIPYALLRMLLQLILIGYVLTYLFDASHPLWVVVMLFIMIISATVIAMRPLSRKLANLYLYTLIALVFGGTPVLFLVTQGALHLTPWYEPRYLIPLSGMLYANAMTSISIAAERFESEYTGGATTAKAKAVSFKASLIPTINALFAVGLVSLPGMMTGQILSGIDPLEASRYQILVMLMILGSSGMTTAIYLTLASQNRATLERPRSEE